MKIKYLFERTEDILRRINESEGSRQWKFVANSQCCQKCLDMDGLITNSDQQPQWYAHVPELAGRYNCRCEWQEIL